MQNSKAFKQNLQKLYNQNTSIQDAELTCFFYYKTLALQFLTVIFTLVSILAVLQNYFNPNSFVSADKLYYITTLFTILTIATIVFQKLSLIQWVKQKKDLQFKPIQEVIYMIVEILLLVPTPNAVMDQNLPIYTFDIYGNPIVFYVEDLLAAYILIRCLYFLKFVIHCELYYGSRPDRLSRLYSVNFGTWNAFKFLINQKPAAILITICLLNYVFLPLVLLVVEGKVNNKLNTFIACLYNQVVTQVTVGYGDVTVSTYVGRAVIVISIIIGITTTSIILIFFMRLMEQDSNQEESHALFSILQRKGEITKAVVQRIQTQVYYLSKKVPLEQRQENQQKLNQFKFKNATKISQQNQTVPNLKRTMIANFTTLLQRLNELKQTQATLASFIKIIQKSSMIKVSRDQREEIWQ